MRLVSSKTVRLLRGIFEDDFIFGIETSANEHGMFSGIEAYITIYSNGFSSHTELILGGVSVYVDTMPQEDIELDSEHT